jgi:DHA1 family multidrug resistance protein-like MFS transporter
MKDIIREAPLGQIIRFLSRNRFFQYPEEHPDFKLPTTWASQLNGEKDHQSSAANSTTLTLSFTPAEQHPGISGDIEGLTIYKSLSRYATTPYSVERFQAEQQLAISRTKTIPIVPEKTSDGIVLVDWYTTDDPANPQNWSSLKRGFVTFLICAYTWVVYTGSSIYAPSEGGVMEHFGVSATSAALPLALYVLAYGVG